MTNRDKKKGRKSSRKKMGRFKTAYKAVMTDRIRLLLLACAVISFVVVAIVILWVAFGK